MGSNRAFESTPPRPMVLASRGRSRPQALPQVQHLSAVFESIVGDYFSKFQFIYCGTKCLRKHSKLGFKPFE